MGHFTAVAWGLTLSVRRHRNILLPEKPTKIRRGPRGCAQAIAETEFGHAEFDVTGGRDRMDQKEHRLEALGVQGNQARLGIEAPDDVAILREESLAVPIWRRQRAARRSGVRIVGESATLKKLPMRRRTLLVASPLSVADLR